ncbi:MAG: cytochrome c biogenesis protein CcsA [Bacterioplanes sp.]|nr:cytochrome c biogenesis protein CcsA [Bacterioplanes sp.]
MTGIVIAIIASVFYLSAAFRQWQTVTGKQPPNRGFVLLATMLGTLAHLAFFGTNMLSGPYINFAFLQVGSLIAWVVVLLLLFASWRKPIDNLLIGTLPMASAVILLAASSNQYIPLKSLSYGLTWHILMAILAYSIFIIASVQAVLVALQNHFLKRHQTRGLLQALPPLQTMDALLFQMIWLGMVLLTTAFMVGFPFVSDLLEQKLLHKVVFACIGWLVFAGLLIGRYRSGWRGVTASRWTLTGMAFLVLSYFGSRMVLQLMGAE